MPFWVDDDLLTPASWVTLWPQIHSHLAGKSPRQLLFEQVGIPKRYLSGTHSRNFSSVNDSSMLKHMHLSTFQPMRSSSNCLSYSNFSQSCILKSSLLLYHLLYLFFFPFKFPSPYSLFFKLSPTGVHLIKLRFSWLWKSVQQ